MTQKTYRNGFVHTVRTGGCQRKKDTAAGAISLHTA